MGKVLIKDWAVENDKTQLLAHIKCASLGYETAELFVDNIFYDETYHAIDMFIDPHPVKHASHPIEEKILFHGGSSMKFADVAACAIAFTECGRTEKYGEEIPSTREVLRIDFPTPIVVERGRIHARSTIYRRAQEKRILFVKVVISQAGKTCVIAKFKILKLPLRHARWAVA
jgi:acyl-coenzyme A thioesterase PaaI-like protein